MITTLKFDQPATWEKRVAPDPPARASLSAGRVNCASTFYDVIPRNAWASLNEHASGGKVILPRTVGGTRWTRKLKKVCGCAFGRRQIRKSSRWGAHPNCNLRSWATFCKRDPVGNDGERWRVGCGELHVTRQPYHARLSRKSCTQISVDDVMLLDQMLSL